MIIRHGRTEDIPGIAKVHVDSWKTTYRGIVPDSYLSSLDIEEREESWKQIFAAGFAESVLLAAENEQGEVVGFASGGRERTGKYPYSGELYAIYLLEEYQRRGIGRKLFSELASRLIDKGYSSMLVWVLADNPCRPFYESFHPVQVDEETIEIGGTPLQEIAFAWSDITGLAAGEHTF